VRVVIASSLQARNPQWALLPPEEAEKGRMDDFRKALPLFRRSERTEKPTRRAITHQKQLVFGRRIP
jgi:hypothetical protein